MRIALASVPVKNRDVSFNLISVLDTINTCSGKADIVLFGESVLQGFDCLSWDFDTDRHIALSLSDELLLKLCDAAKLYHIALSIGFIERADGSLYSSQIFIDSDGRILDVFHRVSVGWKDYSKTDTHYKEGTCFHTFSYAGKTFATALCGDLWTDGRPEEMSALQSDVVLWPVWCDYEASDWNEIIKFEYALQASKCGNDVLLVNSFCADLDSVGCAEGGSVHFQNGRIRSELAAGDTGILYVDI